MARRDVRDTKTRSYRHRMTTSANDAGFTLVELLVAFTALIVLFTITGTAVTTYL